MQFLTALLTVRGDKADKTLDNLKEAKRMGVRILPPNINKSDMAFKPEGNGIRYGLLSIAGIGERVVQTIIEERQKNGPYLNFDDFIRRTTFKGSPVNRGAYRTLIEAGCFDDFEPNRYHLLNYYNFQVRGDKVWPGSQEELENDKKAKSNHSYRFDENAFTKQVALEMERRLIGVYISGSPFENLPYTSLSDMELSTRRQKEYYDIGGRIQSLKVIKTKQGKPMAFVTLETQLDPIEVTFFPEAYKKYEEELYRDNIIVVRGYKEKSFYKGEDRENFIGEKVLVKEARKLKKEMGIKINKPIKVKGFVMPNGEIAELPDEEEAPKPKKRPDPVAEMLDDDRRKKKRRRDPDDISIYFDDEEEEAS